MDNRSLKDFVWKLTVRTILWYILTFSQSICGQKRTNNTNLLMRLVHQILVHVETAKKLVSPLLQSLLPLVDDVVVP